MVISFPEITGAGKLIKGAGVVDVEGMDIVMAGVVVTTPVVVIVAMEVGVTVIVFVTVAVGAVDVTVSVTVLVTGEQASRENGNVNDIKNSTIYADILYFMIISFFYSFFALNDRVSPPRLPITVKVPRTIRDGFINVLQCMIPPWQVPIKPVGIRIAETPKTMPIIERLSKLLLFLVKNIETPTTARGAPTTFSALADCWQGIAEARSVLF